MTTGIVKWFNPIKGFGFIIPDEGGGDIFIKTEELLEEGQAVSFELEMRDSGRMGAKNLVKL